MAKIGEATGALPEGTLKALEEDIGKEAKPIQIDVKGLDEFFKKVRGNVGLVEANLNGLGDKIANWAHDLKLRAGDEGLHPMGKAAFESAQATWERLQKGMLGQDPMRIARDQLEQQKEAKRILEDIRDKIGLIIPTVI
jgi:hypothetical protein